MVRYSRKKSKVSKNNIKVGGFIERKVFQFPFFCKNSSGNVHVNKMDYDWDQFYLPNLASYIPTSIYYKRGAEQEQFLKKGRIGGGAGGQVYKYKNVQNENYIALKISKKWDDNEQELVDDIKDKLGERYPCNIVPLQKIIKEDGSDTSSQNYYVMPGMDGVLNDLFDNVDEVNNAFDTQLKSQRFSASLFEELEGFIRCLNKLGYIYLDLKLEQILYHCLGKNKFEIYVGDLGSLMASVEGTSVASFPPPDACGHTKGRHDDALSMGEPGAVPILTRNQDWVLGILALLLRGNLSAYDKIPFYVSNKLNLSNINTYGILSIFHWGNCDKKIFNDAMKDKDLIRNIVEIAYPRKDFPELHDKILMYLRSIDTSHKVLARTHSAPSKFRVMEVPLQPILFKPKTLLNLEDDVIKMEKSIIKALSPIKKKSKSPKRRTKSPKRRTKSPKRRTKSHKRKSKPSDIVTMEEIIKITYPTAKQSSPAKYSRRRKRTPTKTRKNKSIIQQPRKF
jgi:hypothetical protein